MIVYTKDDYAKAYTEIIEILKYISKEDLNKIPQEKLEFYLKKRDVNYQFKYDDKLLFEQQKISRLTKIIIANLYVEYWAEEEERKQIKNKDKLELEKQESQKREKYSYDNLFKKNKRESEITSMVVVKEKNIIQKILYKIKKFFN